MLGPLQHLRLEGKRHTGVYGFGGRNTRRAYMVGGDNPALLVDRNVWSQLADRYAAEHPGRFGSGMPGLFGTPVQVLAPVDGEAAPASLQERRVRRLLRIAGAVYEQIGDGFDRFNERAIELHGSQVEPNQAGLREALDDVAVQGSDTYRDRGGFRPWGV